MPESVSVPFGINDAVRPYETINAGDYIGALRKTITDARLHELVQVGAFDQLTHSDDAIVIHTDWSMRLTREYRDAMGSTPDQ